MSVSTVPSRHPHVPYATADPIEWLASALDFVAKFGDRGREGGYLVKRYAVRIEDRKCTECGKPMFVNYVRSDQQHCIECARKRRREYDHKRYEAQHVIIVRPQKHCEVCRDPIPPERKKFCASCFRAKRLASARDYTARRRREKKEAA